MTMEWNAPALPWQSTLHPWKALALPWNATALPWKEGGAAPGSPANAGGVDAPDVTGTAAQGSTLTCSTGTWTGDATIVYTYQWFRGD